MVITIQALLRVRHWSGGYLLSVSPFALTPAVIPTTKNLYFHLFDSFVMLGFQGLGSLSYASQHENHLQGRSSRITRVVKIKIKIFKPEEVDLQLTI